MPATTTSRFAPRLENLDDRLVPTFIPALVPNVGGTELVLKGDAQNDDAQIRDFGNGVVQVTANGGANTWLFSNINKITVNSEDGHDAVRYDLVGSLQAHRSQTVTVGLGSNLSPNPGNDSFVATLKPGIAIQSGARLQIGADGGGGNDYLSVTAIDVDVKAGGWMKTTVTGGYGDDVVAQLYRYGEMDGTLAMRSLGGKGNDTIRQIMQFDANSTGLTAGRVLGEDGNDTLGFFLYTPPAMTVQLAEVVGGAGVDVLNHTPNVTAIA
jgi:hypothetical protein